MRSSSNRLSRESRLNRNGGASHSSGLSSSVRSQTRPAPFRRQCPKTLRTETPPFANSRNVAEPRKFARADRMPSRATRRRSDYSCGDDSGPVKPPRTGIPYLPNAFERAWTISPSTQTRSKSNDLSSFSKILSKPPCFSQCSNRLKTLIQLTNFAGISRHGAPDPVRRGTSSK